MPTLQELTAIACAARHFARTAHESFFFAGTADPPGFPPSPRDLEIIHAIQSLENALHPGGIPFGDSRRTAIGVQGWPDTLKLLRAMTWLLNCHDKIITALGLQPLCEGKRVIFATEGATVNVAPDVVTKFVPKDWPPKVDRQIVESIDQAAFWIAEVLEAHAEKPPGGAKSANGRHACKGRRGRKAVSRAERSKRVEILEAWKRAKEAGVCRKDFCVDNAIEVADLERYQNWQGQRRLRKKNR